MTPMMIAVVLNLTATATAADAVLGPERPPVRISLTSVEAVPNTRDILKFEPKISSTSPLVVEVHFESSVKLRLRGSITDTKASIFECNNPTTAFVTGEIFRLPQGRKEFGVYFDQNISNNRILKSSDNSNRRWSIEMLKMSGLCFGLVENNKKFAKSGNLADFYNSNIVRIDKYIEIFKEM